MDLYDYLGLMTFPEPRWLTLPFALRPKIWGGNMIFRRSVFETVGGFDVARGRTAAKLYGGEETDIMRRAIEAGFTVFYDPAITVYHHVGRERMRPGYFRRWVFDFSEGKALLDPGASGATILGAPRWMYRNVAREVARLLAAPTSLKRQLSVCWILGRMNGYRKLQRAGRERAAGWRGGTDR